MSGTAGTILAGGRSSRMGGGDKCRLELGGLSLIERVAKRIGPQVDALVISGGDKASNGFGLPYPILADTVADRAGPLAGLLAGLEWAAASGFAWLLSAPCDVPFLPRDLAMRLRDVVAGKELSVAASGGRTHHVIGLWPTRIAETLRRRIVDDELREVGAFMNPLNTGIAMWPSDPYDPFHNINHPEELEAAVRILEEFDP
jgi:molybdenum cofactor guanylyltransferase